MSEYKDAMKAAMTRLGNDPKTRFVGYNLIHGGGAGTFEGVDQNQLVETPVAENLMTGIAIGLSLLGYRPILYFERFDFILNALDAIVNHLDKLKTLSKGQFSPSVIIRVVVGNTRHPLHTGLTHTQDFGRAMDELVSFDIYHLYTEETIAQSYNLARFSDESSMLIEYKDLY